MSTVANYIMGDARLIVMRGGIWDISHEFGCNRALYFHRFHLGWSIMPIMMIKLLVIISLDNLWRFLVALGIYLDLGPW